VACPLSPRTARSRANPPGSRLRSRLRASALLGAFLTAVQYLVERQRDLVPSPNTVVEATVTSEEIAKQLLTASIAGTSAPPVDATMLKLRQVLGHESFLWSAISQPDPANPDWTLQVPAVLRGYRDVSTIDDYLDRLLELVAPAGTEAPVAWSPGALDIPNAVGYLDAVWKNRTGARMFVNLDPASIARLTQGCKSEDEFNSLMSALADVLGRVVRPGQAAPPQQTALEAVQGYLASALDSEVADRVTGVPATDATRRAGRETGVRELAEWMNPVIHGYRTEMNGLLRRINTYLWARATGERERRARGAADGLRRRGAHLC
jgi:hypothetical protein